MTQFVARPQQRADLRLVYSDGKPVVRRMKWKPFVWAALLTLPLIVWRLIHG